MSEYWRLENVTQEITYLNTVDGLFINSGLAELLDVYTDDYLWEQQERYEFQFQKLVDDGIVTPMKELDLFKNVFVGLEGEVAFAAIKNSPNAYPELANSIINSLKEKYPKVADKINNQFIKNIKDAIGFDLGGKTSDCTVITNGKPNIMASNSIMRGYDNVLQRSVDYLQTKNYGFDNIRQLQKYLNEDENPFAPGSKEKVIKVVSSAAEPFADEIVSNASQTLRKIGTSIKIGFVFGGAAVPMKTTRLYEKLNNKFMSFNGDQIIPIVWVDGPYAQVLNRMGLVLILKALMGPKE